MPPDPTNPPQPVVPPPIKDVTQPNVGKTVQRFLDYDAVKRLEVKVQLDGKFTITPNPINDTPTPQP